jgi:hypothetical protein
MRMISGKHGARSYKKKWLFFFILIAFSVFVIYDHRPQLFDDFHAGDYQKMIILLVLLFPLFFAFKVLARGNHYRRFGDTPLNISPSPLMLGQQFSGAVSVSRGAKYLDGMQFRAELRLLQRSEAEQGDNQNSRVDTLWKEPLSVASEYGAAGAGLSIKSRLPNDQPATSGTDKQVADGGSQYSWQLSITSSDKKFKQSWNVPVAKAH